VWPLGNALTGPFLTIQLLSFTIVQCEASLSFARSQLITERSLPELPQLSAPHVPPLPFVHRLTRHGFAIDTKLRGRRGDCVDGCMQGSEGGDLYGFAIGPKHGEAWDCVDGCEGSDGDLR